MKSNQFGKTTPLGMGLIAIIAAAVLIGGLYGLQRLRPAGQASSVPTAVEAVVNSAPAQYQHGGVPIKVAQAPLPSSNVAGANGSCRVNVLTLPWNGTMGLQYANGGPQTTSGSLMDKQGLRVVIARQDDYGKMQEALIKFATQVKAGVACPSEGAAYVIIMGDAGAGFAQGIQKPLGELGLSLEMIGSVGSSYGEDACMLPHEVKQSPQKARGSLVGAVMRDGDYNICAVWAAQNGIPINPDEKTYDPEAMNFLSVSAFTEADEGVIAGKCEDRLVVSKGKRTGEKKNVCQNGTATWTPGDVNVAMKKGGLGKVASTREYSNQMAATLFGINAFSAKNPKIAEGILEASWKGSDAVNSSHEALLFAGGVSAKVYGEQDAAYWAKYFKGVTENDKTGVPIALGGSRAWNGADNAYYFGLSGGEDVYKRVYTMFGDHNVKYYPSAMDSYPRYEKIVNLAYMRNVIARSGAATQVAATQPIFQSGQAINVVTSKRSWTIEFDTGKASIRPESMDALNELLDQVVITSLAVEIRGHTDNVGSEDTNLVLSRKRADAVKTFLMANATKSITDDRVRTKGFGQQVPVADNKTAEGRAKNRRVEVILGTTN